MSETRDRIVEAARELFARQGYQATSLADLRAFARVHSGSFYHAFPTKQALLIAVLAHYRDHIDERLIGPAWQDVADPVERVFALLVRYRTFLEQSRMMFGCPIGSIALELRAPDPPVRAMLAENFDAWIARVEACYAEAAQQRGVVLDARALAVFTLTTMEGAVMLARTYRDIHCFDTAIAALRDHVAHQLG
jgi:TetR/AcrR family transcriptional repressor of nem operon